MKQLINQIILGHVSNKEMFTAYDITRTAKSLGMNVNHSDVRNEVHACMHGNIGYTRTMRTFGLKMFPAWVYHPIHMSADSYDPDKSLPSVTVSTTTATISTNTVTGKVVNVGKGNRVRVPAQLVRDIGLSSGDHAQVEFGNGAIVIAPSGKGETRTVDEYGNILLRPKNSVNSYLASVQNKKIVLTPI